MSKRYRVVGAWLSLLLLFMTVLAPPAPAATQLRLVVNGRQMVPEVPARLVSGRVMVPVRTVGEALGAQVIWEQPSKVTLRRGEQEVYACVGAKTGWCNGVAYPLDVAPLIVGGRLLVPVRFFSEGLGAKVVWNSATRAVHIMSDGYTPPADEVWAYYYGSTARQGLEMAASSLTQVVIFSFVVDGKGNLAETTPYPEAKREADAKGLEASILIFQNDQKVLGSLLSNAAARRNLVRQVADLVSGRDYSGVNLDLEGVPASCRDGYVQLVQALAAELRPEGKTVSLSVPAKESDAVSWQKGYDYARLGKAADQVVVMVYDQHHATGMPGPVAGLDWAGRVVKYAAGQISPDKLLLGLGTYGYDWPPAGRAQALTPEQAASLAQSRGIKPQWDKTAAVPYFRYWDAAGRQHQVWYENMESLTLKMNLAGKYGLAGVAVWRLGFPPQDFWQQVARTFNISNAA